MRLPVPKSEPKFLARIRRASLGNFGDWKPLAGAHGIFEMRIHAGAGYRVVYTVLGNTVVLLLAGATKKDQRRTLERAKVYLEDYRKRMKP
ncbi:type II toxin-antitoxin system RelE/ParE family toxin [Allorhizobium sp. NPDC080224]|uniref:type II toxin-antitoxin system RelE/ParE family toxin n=1 Tax=Allorhizobium sp. NPDC080224 TaxID=3390547 RepID=UPI003CFE88F7